MAAQVIRYEEIECIPNKPLRNGPLEGWTRVFEKTKGSADFCKLINQSCKLSLKIDQQALFLPVGGVEFAEKMQSLTATARSVLGIPYWFSVYNKFFGSFQNARKNGIDATVIRDGGELAATTSYALDVLTSDKALSKNLNAAGAVLKCGVEAYDCWKVIDEKVKISEKFVAMKGVNVQPEVVAAMGNKSDILDCRIWKLALSVIVGIGTILGLVFGVALPPAIAIGLLVLGTVSVIFSMMADYKQETVPYTMRFSR
jgi:hypothetical protein